MKIYGLDGKEYSTIDECLSADEAYTKAKEEAEKKENEKKSLISKQKKEKANLIRVAEIELDAAQANYDRAEEKAREILTSAKESARKLIADASKELKKAFNKKYETIANFNKEFGTYTTTYTGKEDLEEYNRLTRNFNNLWDSFWGNWF